MIKLALLLLMTGAALVIGVAVLLGVSAWRGQPSQYPSWPFSKLATASWP